VAERLKAPVLKTATVYPAAYHRVTSSQHSSRFPSLAQRLYPVSYCPVPPSWVAKWVGNPRPLRVHIARAMPAEEPSPHAALLARLPVFTTTIRRWLKAGVVELGGLDPTTMGTPQGGIISPLLANIALDGMERLFGAERPDGRHITPCLRRGSNRGINLVRYADDFVVTAPSREVLEGSVIPRLDGVLASSGLELSQAKTRIVQLDDGFDFLGFNLRHFPNGKLLVRLQTEKVALHRRRLSAFFRATGRCRWPR
jgi:hypothetical protein